MAKANKSPRKPTTPLTETKVTEVLQFWEKNPNATNAYAQQATGVSHSRCGKLRNLAIAVNVNDEDAIENTIRTGSFKKEIVMNPVKEFCTSHPCVKSWISKENMRGERKDTSDRQMGSDYKQMMIGNIDHENLPIKPDNSGENANTLAEDWKPTIEKFGDIAAKTGRMFKVTIVSFELGGKAN